MAELEALNGICKEVNARGEVTENHKGQLSAAFGSRFAKAWEALEQGRIKKYIFKPSGRIVWIVVGKGRDYLIMPAADFCSCEDFYFKFDKGHLCYHIIAQKLAEATGQFDLIEDWDSLYEILIKEWKRIPL